MKNWVMNDILMTKEIEDILDKYNLTALKLVWEDKEFVKEVLVSYFENNGCPQDLDWVYSLINE